MCECIKLTWMHWHYVNHSTCFPARLHQRVVWLPTVLCPEEHTGHVFVGRYKHIFFVVNVCDGVVPLSVRHVRVVSGKENSRNLLQSWLEFGWTWSAWTWSAWTLMERPLSRKMTTTKYFHFPLISHNPIQQHHCFYNNNLIDSAHKHLFYQKYNSTNPYQPIANGPSRSHAFYLLCLSTRTDVLGALLRYPNTIPKNRAVSQ